MKEEVIFAIDNGHTCYHAGRFEYGMAQLRATGAIPATPQKGIGSWVDPEGRVWLEQCYVMSLVDYRRHVIPLGCTAQQHSVLVVDGEGLSYLCHPLTLEPIAFVGQMGAGSEAPEGQNWTYLSDVNRFFTAKAVPEVAIAAE